MTITDRIANWFGYTKTATIEKAPQWVSLTAAAEQYSIPDRALPEAQLELYKRLSWVQIAVSQVAAQAAIVPFRVMQRKGEKTEAIENHPFELLLDRPNPMMSRFEFMEATKAYYALTGQSFWWLNRANENAAPDEVWVIPPQNVKPVPDRRMFIRGYEFDSGKDGKVFLEPWEVVHFKRFNPLNSFVGLSPIEALATVATADMNMQKTNASTFDKGSIKTPGALAFSDPIPDDQWKVMRKEIEDQYGGNKRKMMLLRNVGKGGVEWLPMSVTMADMQFLESRTFTKEEIWAMYAPGLSSMLSVNATEANSDTGRKTFIELAVWPHLVRIAGKITNDVLPIYGENLVGEFDDIRVSDRSMALSEQQAFERVHTIDEVREKFYQASPIGDDRGKLLPAEIGKGLTKTTEPEPPPVMMPPQTPNQPTQDNAEPDMIDGEDAPDNNADDTPDANAIDQEAKAFRRWLKRRPNAHYSQFKAEHLSDEALQSIYTQVREGGTGHRFFTQKATPRLPGVDDGNDAERAKLERKHAKLIADAFSQMLAAIVPAGTTESSITPELAVSRLQDQRKLLRDAMASMLLDGAKLGADTGVAQVETLLGVAKAVEITGVNWDLANEAVIRWVLGATGGGFGLMDDETGYADTITLALMQTSERQIRAQIGEWVRNGLPLEHLVNQLEATVFGRDRAIRIATTETTRAYAEGNRAAWRESKVVRRMRWQTNVDERVCPLCAPLADRVAGVAGDFGGFMPPRHPGCRCWITPVVGDA